MDPVGYFGPNTRLSFVGISDSLAVPGSTVDVSFEFSPAAGMAAGERLSLYLPGFGGTTKAGVAVSRPAGYFTFCNWNLTDSVLSFYAATGIPPASSNGVSAGEITVVAPASAIGIVLPAIGVHGRNTSDSAAGDDPPYFSTNAEVGPIDWTAVAMVEGVGAVTAAQLEFKCAPSACIGDINLTLSFVALSGLQSGDMLIISGGLFIFPAAAGPFRSSTVEALPTGTFASVATWKRAPAGECGWQLSLTVGKGAATGVLITAALGPLRVPLSGLSSSSELSLSVDSLYAPVAAIPVLILTPVPPAISNLTLQIIPKEEMLQVVGGSEAIYKIEFDVNTILSLSAEPAILLYLPGFGPDVSWSIMPSPDGCGADHPSRGCRWVGKGAWTVGAVESLEAFDEMKSFAAVSWDPVAQVLSLSAFSAAIPSGIRYQIIFPANFGLLLPIGGVSTNPSGFGAPSIVLAADGREDEVYFSKIFVGSNLPSANSAIIKTSTSQIVPPILSVALISFDPPAAGAKTVSAVITIGASENLPSGSTISIYLSSLALPSVGINAAAIHILPKASAATASWISSQGALVVTLGESGTGLEASALLTLTLPASLGIGLPILGIAGDGEPSLDLEFSSIDDSGNTTITTIPRSPFNLALYPGVFLELTGDYNPRIPSRPTEVSVTVSFSTILAHGDKIVVHLQGFWLAGAASANLTAVAQVLRINKLLNNPSLSSQMERAIYIMHNLVQHKIRNHNFNFGIRKVDIA